MAKPCGEKRYLGNSNTEEVHDLDNEQTNCQIGEIKKEHIVCFSTLSAAKKAGYDNCAWCNLSIERIGEAYRAQVTSSPVGPRAPVPIDPIRLDPGEPGENGETLRDVRRRPLDRNDLRRIGERLFSAVFVGGIGEAFRASVVRVRGEGLGLRIRLQLDEAPELASLPWEALWDPEARTFLADRPDLPVVRALRLKAPSVRPLQPPLQLVALLPEPRGETKIGGPEEWQRILEHLKPLIDRGVVEAEWPSTS